MTGGGGECLSDTGFIWVKANRPENDNTWRVICDTSKDQYATAHAYVICT